MQKSQAATEKEIEKKLQGGVEGRKKWVAFTSLSVKRPGVRACIMVTQTFKAGVRLAAPLPDSL